MSSDLVKRISETAMKALWKEHGGAQHGPIVEQYYIEEQAWYRFARAFEDRVHATCITALEAQLADAKARAAKLVETVDALGLRKIVAGWNGKNRDDGPYEPHPSKLGVMLRTTVGHVYAIDRETEAVRALIKEQP